MGRPSKNSLKNNVELNYVDVKDLEVDTITDSTPPEVNKVEADAWDQLANGEKPEILKTTDESIEDVKKWAEGTPPEAVEAILREQVHIMGHDVGLGIDEEEPIPDIEDDGVDPEDIIDSLVIRKPFVAVYDVDVPANEENPRIGQNAAVRNVYSTQVNGKATIAPTISSSAKHSKPYSVKSVEGNRTGMFRINPDKPIRN